MKFLIVVAVALASAAAAPASYDEAGAPIVKSDYEISPEGAFQYAYETGNGIYSQASGALKAVNGENAAVAVSGAYKYTAPSGETIETSYIADENGFQPQGSHLPVSPPIPDAIARAIAYIAAHPPAAAPSPAATKPNYYGGGGSGIGRFPGGVASLLG